MPKLAAPLVPINYAAVLADLEEKRSQLDSAITAIKVLIAQTGDMAATAPPVPRISRLDEVPPDAFVGLSISNAVRRLLEMMQRRLSMREILEGLRAGGLKPNKYRNVYSIIRGREAYQADIIKVNRQWGLAEWNPEIPPRSNLIDQRGPQAPPPAHHTLIKPPKTKPPKKSLIDSGIPPRPLRSLR